MKTDRIWIEDMKINILAVFPVLILIRIFWPFPITGVSIIGCVVSKMEGLPVDWGMLEGVGAGLVISGAWVRTVVGFGENVILIGAVVVTSCILSIVVAFGCNEIGRQKVQNCFKILKSFIEML